jgi:hypothetical protein
MGFELGKSIASLKKGANVVALPVAKELPPNPDLSPIIICYYTDRYG